MVGAGLDQEEFIVEAVRIDYREVFDEIFEADGSLV